MCIILLISLEHSVNFCPQNHGNIYTICPGRCDPFYIVSYNIKWITTSWTPSIRSWYKKLDKISEILFNQEYKLSHYIIPISIWIFEFLRRQMIFHCSNCNTRNLITWRHLFTIWPVKHISIFFLQSSYSVHLPTDQTPDSLIYVFRYYFP